MTTTLAPPIPTPASSRTGAGPVRTAAIFIGRSLRQNVRDGEALLMAVLLPVMLMLMFTFVFGGAIDTGGDYLTYVVPGIILTCAGFGASGVAVSVNKDVTTGAMNRFRTLPITSPMVLVGHVVASLLRNMLATAIVVGVALAIGYRPEANLLAWLAAAGMIALYILAITAVFAFIGLMAGGPESANGYGFILLFLPYVSSAFVPVETMPTWMHGFAEHQPSTPVIETIRGLLTSTDVSGAGLPALAWCLSLIAVAAVLVVVFFGRRVRR